MATSAVSTVYAPFAILERIRRDQVIIGLAFFIDSGATTDVSAQLFEFTFEDASGIEVLKIDSTMLARPATNKLTITLTDAQKALLSNARYNYTLYNVTKQRTELTGVFSWVKGKTNAFGVMSAPDIKIIYNMVTGTVEVNGLVFQGITGQKGDTGTQGPASTYLANASAVLKQTELNAMVAVKSVRIFNGNPSKRYGLVTLCKADTNYGYLINIWDLDTSTLAVNSNVVPDNPTGINVITLNLPSNGGTLELIIDYSAIATGIIINDPTSKLEFAKSVFISGGTLKGVVNTPLFFRNGTNLITVGKGANNRPMVVIPAGFYVRATFKSGTAFFRITPGSYEFSGAYKVLCVDMSGGKPTDNTDFTPVERDFASADDTTKYFPLASIWNRFETDAIVFAGPLVPFVDRTLTTPQALALPFVSSTQTLGISKIKEWITPTDFASRMTTSFGRINQTVTYGDREEGFIGTIAKLVSTNATNLTRLCDGFTTLDLDRTKDLYVEFDYKIVSGAWTLFGYTYPTRTAVVDLPAKALAATTTVRRVRLKYTAAEVNAITAGNKFNPYLACSISGGEMWFGNFKMWQGDETAMIPDEDRLIPANAKALNSLNLSASQVQAAFSGSASAAAGIRSNRNLRISCAGSSVTWGDGFLQSSMVGQLITRYQKEAGTIVDVDTITVANAASNVLLSSANDRKLFGGKGRRITGAGAEINFTIDGDELSFVQQIDRSQAGASDIELYVDSVLYDTFNNLNPAPMGTATKNLVGDGATIKFDLGQAFTFNHSVTVAGAAKVGGMNTGSYGSTIPAGQDFMIIRKYGPNAVSGLTEVHHWIWFAVAPAASAAIAVTFDYGEEISYERTSIGKNAVGTLESGYGDGSVAYDATNPTGMSSGLDFRETDTRAVKIYRFSEAKTRSIKLKIKGLTAGATGTPYFTFNFATNRLLWFQNAGIGGWSSNAFNTSGGLTSYKQIIGFNPDILIYESTPNDDWNVKGHKLSRAFNGLTLAQLRAMRTLPAKSFTYQSGNDTYDYQRWAGEIQAIESTRVQILADSTHFIDTAPAIGDVVMLGGYFSNNREYISRLVASYDAANRWITFDRPIEPRDLIYDSLSQLVGMEVRVRDLAYYVNETRKLAETIRAQVPDVKIGFLGNPLPNLNARELWGYHRKIDELADVLDAYFVETAHVYDWQYSQPRTSGVITIDATTLTTNPINGRKGIDLSTLAAALNAFNFEVIVDNKNVYGTNAVVYTGYGLAPDPTKSGAALNMTSAVSGVAANQVLTALKPRLEFLKNAPASGNITLRYSNAVWSADSCHIGNTDDGAKLFGTAYVDAVRSLLLQVETNRRRIKAIDPSTTTVQQLAQALQDAGIIFKY